MLGFYKVGINQSYVRRVDLAVRYNLGKITLCRINSLDIEEIAVKIAKGSTRTSTFLAMNPLGKVPFLEVRVFIAGHIHIAYTFYSEKVPS